MEMFFPANLHLANTKETKPNTTKANIHLEHKYAIKGVTLLKSTLDIFTAFDLVQV